MSLCSTDFIDCVAWRSTAEFISKYFTKGSLSAVVGRLQIRDWVDKDGNKRRNDYSSPVSSPVPASKFTELSDNEGELPL